MPHKHFTEEAKRTQLLEAPSADAASRILKPLELEPVPLRSMVLPRPPAPRTSPMFVANRAPPMSQGILDHARVDRSIVRNNVGEARLLKHMKAHPYLYETRPGQNLPPYAGPIKRLC